MFLLVGQAPGLEIGRSIGMIRAAHVGVSTTNNTFFGVEREILGFIYTRIDLIGPGCAGDTDLFIAGVLDDKIGLAFAQEGALDIFYDIILFGGKTRVAPARSSSKYDTAGTVDKSDSRARFIGGSGHQTFTPVFNRARLEIRPFDDIFRIGEITAFRIAAEVVQWVAFGYGAVCRRAGITWKYAPRGALFGRPDCDVLNLSEIERP